MTAKAFATLDELSGGRVVLGVGAGHVEAEFDVLGIPFAERGRLTDEAIDGIRAAWSDEFGWGDGTFGQRPRPRQPGGPPIWVGGSSPAALRRAGQRGDGWLPQGTTKKEMAEAIATVHRHRAEAGRTGEFTVGALLRPLYLGDPGAGWDLGQGHPRRRRRPHPPGGRRLRGHGRRPGAGPVPQPQLRRVRRADQRFAQEIM